MRKLGTDSKKPLPPFIERFSDQAPKGEESEREQVQMLAELVRDNPDEHQNVTKALFDLVFSDSKKIKDYKDYIDGKTTNSTGSQLSPEIQARITDEDRRVYESAFTIGKSLIEGGVLTRLEISAREQTRFSSDPDDPVYALNENLGYSKEVYPTYRTAWERSNRPGLSTETVTNYDLQLRALGLAHVIKSIAGISPEA